MKPDSEPGDSLGQIRGDARGAGNSLTPRPTESVSRRFHIGSSLTRPAGPPPPVELWPQEWREVVFKGYPRLAIRPMPAPALSPRFTLRQALKQRRSCRLYSPEFLPLATLSSLLHFSVGVRNSSAPDLSTRYYPSAGARYPLETYVAARNVEGLPAGLYHYFVPGHGLEEVELGPTPLAEIDAQVTYEWMTASAAGVLLTAVFGRTQTKYGERGYRHVLTEVGAVMQNVYLVSAALGIGCCAYGGYFDDGLNALLDLEDDQEGVVAMMFVGSGQESAPGKVAGDDLG